MNQQNNAADNNISAVRRQLQEVVFRQGYREAKNPYSKNVFEKLTNCHTAKQGVHKSRCSDSECAYEHYQYHNCGNPPLWRGELWRYAS
jgi:Transposase zinc-binding domain